jgi:negative regulator of flagellin synthesis FlgM
MDIRNSLDGLKSLLGVSPADTTTLGASKQPSAATSTSDSAADRATFSSAASQVASTSDDASVRLDKVASIQSALAAGTYNVPASAVAARLVDSMLGNAA